MPIRKITVTDVAPANFEADLVTTVSAQAATAQQIAFIDSRVPEYQVLANGVNAGVTAVMLDPDRDGLTQIADYLSAQPDRHLLAINIVAHGGSATMALGNSVLSNATLDQYGWQLTRIGAAMQPAGDLMLYGCDVASGADGRQFIANLARLAGANVAAATHQVGSPDLGGSWRLDASTGPIEATLPFTDATLAFYQGVLAIKWTVQGVTPFPSPNFGSRIVTADFNNDGKLDILYQDANTASTGIHLALGNGDGTFQTPIDKPAGLAFGSGPLSGLNFNNIIGNAVTYAVDLNGDGKVDIIDDEGSSAPAIVYMNTGSGYTVAANPFGNQQFTGRMVFGDFNNDGFIDVLNQAGNVAGTGITLYLNNGTNTPTFTPTAQPTNGAFATGPLAGIAFTQVTATFIYAADLNGDGKVDIIDSPGGMGGTPAATRVFQNTGSGFTSVANPFAGQAFSGHFVFGDFNSDGYIDVLNQTSDSNGATSGGSLVLGAGISLYLNNANGSISFNQIVKPDGSAFTSGPFKGVDFTQINPANQRVGDFNNDGDVDIDDSQNGPSAGGPGSRFITQGGDTFNAPPHVSSANPADNSTGVSPTANVVLTFDEAVSIGSGNIQIIKTSDGSVFESIPVGDTRVTGSGTSWTINPSGTLAGNTGYAVHIAAGAFHNSDGAIFAGITDNTTLNFVTAIPNVAPTLAVTSANSTFTESTLNPAASHVTPVQLISSATITDPDNTQEASASVTISTGFLTGDVLTINGLQSGTINNISFSYSAGTMTLTGADTVAHYNAALALVSFASTSDNPTSLGTDNSRTLTWSINDGQASNASAVTSTVAVVGTNDAPSNNGIAAKSGSEDSSIAITGLSVSDVDANAATDTVTVTLSVGHGTLTLNTGVASGLVAGNITNNGSATVTITAAASVINATLANATGLQYKGALNFNGSDTLQIVTADGGHTGAGGTQSHTDTLAITVNPVNDAPLLANVGPGASSTEQVSAVLDNNVTVSDVDLDALNGGSGNYAGASMTIARNGGASTQDSFGFDTSGAAFTVSGGNLLSGGSIFATFTNSGGTLTINFTSTGATATTALVNDVIDHVAYQNLNDNPPSSITLNYNFSDGNTGSSGLSPQGSGATPATATGSTVVTITGVNDAPVNAVPLATQTVAEDTNLVFNSVNGNLISISDVDANAGTETVTLSVGHGTLTLGSTAGLTGLSGNGSATVSFTGTVAQANTALSGLTYKGVLDFNGSDTLSITTSDNGNSPSGPLQDHDTVAISVSAVNDAPVATITPASYNATEGLGLDLKTKGLAVSDIDGGSGIETATLSVTEGILTVTAGGSGAVVSNSGTSSVTITGTLAQINALLNTDDSSTVAYVDGNGAPGATATLTLAIDDGGNTGSGGAKSASDTATINITPVNDAPVATITPASYSATEGLGFDLKNNGLAVSDVDGGSGIETVTLSVGEGVLNVTPGGSLATVSGSGTSTVTITGTIAHINALLNSDGTSTVSFIDNSDNPAASTLLTLSIDDGGHTGGGALTASDVATINIAPVNDPPVATADAYSTTQDSVLIVPATAGVLSNDSDPEGSALTAALVDDVTHGTLTLNADGSFTYTPDPLYTGPDSFTYQAVDDALPPSASNASTITTVTLNVTASGAATPAALVSSPSYSATEQIALSLKDALSVTDTNGAASAETVILSVGEGVLNVTAGDSGANVNGDGTGTVTITGTLAQINALLATGSTSTLSYTDGSHTPATHTTLTFSVTDSGSHTSSNSATIFIEAVNENPVATITPPSYAATEQTALSLKNNGLAVSDVDGGSGIETATLSVTEGTLNVTAGTSGASVSGTGTSSVTITGTLAQINALLVSDAASTVNYIDNTDTPSVTATLSLTVDDGGHTGTGGALSGSATATINITAVNDAPVAADDAYFGSLNAPVNGTVLANDTDADHDLLTAVKVTDPSHGHVTFNSDGTFIYTPDLDFVGSDRFTYKTFDGALNSNVATVTINLANGPLAATPDSYSTNEDVPLVVAVAQGVLANDHDLTPGAILNATITTNAAHGTAVLNADGSFTYTPNANYNGDDSFTYDVSDGTFHSTATVDLTVNAVNDAPVNTAPASATTDEDVPFAFTGANTISISDLDAGAGNETVTLTVASGTLHLGSTAGLFSFTNDAASIVLTGTLTEVNTSLASLSYLGNLDFNGSDTLTILTSDNGNSGADPSTVVGQPDTGTATDEQASSTVAITVNAVNDAPAVNLNGGPLAYTENDAATKIAPTAAVTDVDSGDFNGGSLKVHFGANGAAEDQLSILTDGTVTVTAGVVSIGGNAVGTVSGGANGADLVVSFNSSGNATAAAITTLIEHIGYADNSDNPSTAPRSLTFSVVDGDGGTDTGTATATINVTATNDAPQLSVPANYISKPNVAIAITGITFSDADDNGGVEQVTLTVVSGTLAGASSGGVTIGGTATALTLTGTITDLNNYIAGSFLTYTTATSQSIGVSINDLGHTGTPGAQSTSTSVPVIIDNPPTAPVDNDAATANAVAENAAANSYVGITAHSTDADNDPLTYSLTSNPGGFFQIDALTGVVTTTVAGAAGIDFESHPLYTITVGANDGQVTTTQNFTINILDANDAPTISGSVTGQAVTGVQPLKPFTTVTIADQDLPAQTETVSVTLDHPDHGAFTAASLTASGFTAKGGGSGEYDFTGTAAAATAAIRQLEFQAVPGTTTNPTPTTTFTIVVSDGSLSASDAHTTVIASDLTPPGAPTIALTHDTGLSTTDHVTSDPTFIVTPAESGGTLLYKADTAASFSPFAPSFATDGSADGLHTVLVEQQDAAGNIGPATSLSFTLDTTAPDAPTLALTHDTGVSSTDHITNNPAITVTRAESGGILLYKADGAPGFSTTAPGFTTNGPHTLSVEQQDAAGNIGAASANFHFTLDTTAPVLTGITASPGSGSVFAGSTVEFVLGFNEAASATGGTLSLSDGGSAVYDAAATAALHDATKLAFDYLVSSSDSLTPSLTVTGFVPHGGTVADLAGNSATLNNIAATFPLQINESLVPAFVIGGGVTRPALALDAAGEIVLDATSAAFAGNYGTKALYAGLPASTPFPPVDLHNDFHLF